MYMHSVGQFSFNMIMEVCRRCAEGMHGLGILQPFIYIINIHRTVDVDYVGNTY